jgi:site-specific recombinase XerD
MTTTAITPLRQRMIEDMNARKLCAGTQRGHIRSCKRFAAFLKRSPDTATLEDIRRFQLHLADTGVTICNRNRIMTGLRFLFRVTLRRLDLAEEVYHIREPQKLPLVMSADEIKRLLAVASSLKTRVLLSLGYGGGLPAREIVQLKVKHIDSAEDHSHRAVEGPQGPQCDAGGGDARVAAAMVEGAPLASRCGNTAAGTLAVSQQKVCSEADHHPPSQPLVP